MFVLDFVLAFRIAWWPFVRKELPSWLSTSIVLYLIPSLVLMHAFPYEVVGRMWL